MKSGIHQWQDLTTEDFGTLDPQVTVVVLPIAAIEQHGPHLPVSTDTRICRGILDAAVSEAPDLIGPAIVMPVQCVGDSVEHTSFPGTLTHTPGTLVQMMTELGRCVHRAGIHKLVIFNTHGGQTAAMDIAALTLRQELGMLVIKAHSFRFGVPDGMFPEEDLAHDYHGGAVETSMMLHLAPDAVRVDRIANFVSRGVALSAETRHLGPQSKAASFAWMAEDLNASGAIGNATLATAEKGRTLIERAGTTLREIIRDAQETSYPGP